MTSDQNLKGQVKGQAIKPKGNKVVLKDRTVVLKWLRIPYYLIRFIFSLVSSLGLCFSFCLMNG